jgi:hypothetical protein
VTSPIFSPPFLDSDQPGPFSLADPEKLRSILSASGFTGIELTEVKQPLHFGAAMTLSDAVAYGLRVGPASRVIAEADQKLLPAFGQALEDALRPYLTPTGVWLDSAAWLAYAERA